ncbi:MAG: DNA-processing protein DprA [Candidatus Ornithospirochaeta sp.]
MSENTVREKAVAFEALSIFFGDSDKAWKVLEALGADSYSSFASYTREFTSTQEDAGRFDEIWRTVRDKFASEKIPYNTIGEDDPLSKGNISSFHFMYSAGKKSLDSSPRLVVLGPPLPSQEAKANIFDCCGYAASKGWSIVAPLDSGSGSHALRSALKLGAKTIAVLPSFLSKCPSENLLEIMEKVYSEGTLLTPFSPVVKYEKWHVVKRNTFIASFGDAFFLSEEKDGGPSWAIFDAASQEKGKAISINALSNPSLSWCRSRLMPPVITYTKPKDLDKLFHEEKTKRKREKFVDLTPSLFADM